MGMLMNRARKAKRKKQEAKKKEELAENKEEKKDKIIKNLGWGEAHQATSKKRGK